MKQQKSRHQKIMAEIKQLGAQIAKEFKPEKIILFGSHAYGTPHEGADIDLLVIMPYEGGHAQQAIKILNTIDVWLPVDLLVRTPEEVKKRLAMGDFSCKRSHSRGRYCMKPDTLKISVCLEILVFH